MNPNQPTAIVDPAETPEGLVALVMELKARIERETLELKAVEAKVIALGAGKHGDGTGKTVTVVGATSGSSGSVYYTLGDADLDRARELAGEKFTDLFDRKVSFSPCEGFALLAPKLLTPAKARDVVALCARTSGGSSGKTAYVKYK